MKNKIKLSSALLLVLPMMFVGCEDNDDTDYKKIIIDKEEPIEITGVVVDGYIKNSKVCLDLNQNELCEVGEPFDMTNENGEYVINLSNVSSSDRKSKNIIAYGGIDTFSGNSFKGKMKAKIKDGEEENNVSPLTTMLSEKMDTGISYNEAVEKLSQSFQLEKEDIEGDTATGSTKAYLLAVKYQKSKEMLEMLSDTPAKAKEAINSLLKEIDGSVVDYDALLNNSNNNLIKSLNRGLQYMLENVEDKEYTFSERKYFQVKLEAKKKIIERLSLELKQGYYTEDEFEVAIRQDYNKVEEYLDTFNINTLNLLEEAGLSALKSIEKYIISYPELFRLDMNEYSTIDDLEVAIMGMDIKQSFKDYLILVINNEKRKKLN